MKKTRKALSLVLAALLLLAVLAGCGNNAASSSKSPQTSQPATEAPAASGSQPAESEDPSAEPDPEPQGVVYPLTDGEPIELTMWLENNGKAPTFEPIDDISYYKGSLAYAENATGVKIDYQTVAGEAAPELFGAMMASGDWCDMVAHVIKYYPSGLSAAYQQDFVIDLSEHIQEWSPNYYSMITSSADAWAGMTLDDGEIVGYYTFRDVALATWGLGIRADWLDALKLSVPDTIDEMHDVLAAFKSEYSCKAPLLLTNMSQPGYGIVSAFGVPGFQAQGMDAHSHLFLTDDGKVSSSFIEDGYRDYLSTMHQWLTEGLISSDFTSVSWMPFDMINMTGVINGDSGIFYTTANMIPDYAAAAEPGFAAAGIADPTLKKGDVTHFTNKRDYNVDQSLSISTACDTDKVEYAMKWIDWWYGEDGIMLKNYGEKGVAWDYNAASEPEFTDLITKSEHLDRFSQTQITTAFILSSAIPCGENLEKRLYCFYDDSIIASLDAWNKADDKNVLPPIALTPEENESISQKLADAETYASENASAFINGTRSLEDWDAFVEQVMAIGLSDVLETYQAALDRYNAKMDAFNNK